MIYGAVGLLGLAALLFGVSIDPNVGRWFVLYLFTLTAIAHRGGLSGPEWATLAFVGYAVFSLLWSPDRLEGLLRAQNFLAILAVVIFTSRTKFNVGVLAGIVVWGTIVLSFWFPFGAYGNENFRNDTILIAGPLLMYLPKWWRETSLLGWAGLLGLTATGSIIPAFGLVGLGLIVWLMACRAYFSVALIVAVVVNAAVFIDLPESSYWHRVELWHNTLMMWAHSPIFGHGLGSWEYVYPMFSESHLWIFDKTLFTNPTMLSVAAHSDILQILAVFGVIGLGLFVLVLFHVQWKTWAGVACLCGLGAALVGFPYQVPSSAMMAGVALGASFRNQKLFPTWRGWRWVF